MFADTKNNCSAIQIDRIIGILNGMLFKHLLILFSVDIILLVFLSLVVDFLLSGGHRPRCHNDQVSTYLLTSQIVNRLLIIQLFYNSSRYSDSYQFCSILAIAKKIQTGYNKYSIARINIITHYDKHSDNFPICQIFFLRL